MIICQNFYPKNLFLSNQFLSFKLFKTVFTTNEQERYLVVDDYNDEEDNDAKESYIDQIDARSLGQRVELPIPDEELTTILTTTLSIESCKFFSHTLLFRISIIFKFFPTNIRYKYYDFIINDNN